MAVPVIAIFMLNVVSFPFAAYPLVPVKTNNNIIHHVELHEKWEKTVDRIVHMSEKIMDIQCGGVYDYIGIIVKQIAKERNIIDDCRSKKRARPAVCTGRS